MEKILKKSFRKLLLISLVAAFILVCAAGCQNDQTGSVSTASMTEEDFRSKLADSSVQEITLSGDLVLTSPVEVTGSKTLLGAGTVTTTVQDMEGEYLISLASGAELTVGGDVVIDASGVIGGIHVAKDASWILQDNAVVKNASQESANALVEGTFRMNGGSLADALGHNLYNKNETVIAGGEITGSGVKFAGVYNEGKLTQDGGTISGAYNNVVVASGAIFDWNTGINQNSVRDGVFVYAGAKLYVASKDAQLLSSGARGIFVFGNAVIDGITVKSCIDTQVQVAKGASLTLNGGAISDGNYHGVDNAGTMLMTGGDIFSNDDCGIVNTGTLEITSGGIMTNGKKGIVNKHAGNAKVLSEDVVISGNYVAISNEDTAYFELAKASILQSGNTNIYAYDGEMYIHDIALNASGSNNIRVVVADVTLKNVEVNGNTSAGSTSTHGILMEGGTLYGENVTIANTTGSGIRNKGGHLEGKNFAFKKIGQVAINVLDQDVTGRPGSTILDGVTTEDAQYMNILSGGTGVIELSNAVLCPTPSNNVRSNAGTVKLTNVEIQGHAEAATTAHHGVYLEGGEIIASNVSITNTKGHAIRNKGGAFTGYGVYINGVNGDTAISNAVLADGSTGPIVLYNVSIYNVKSKNIVNEGGTTYVYNSTLSPTPGSNIKITGGGVVLNNVHVAGSSADAQGTIHAIIIEGGYGTLTADNVKITGAKNSALRNKTGDIAATNLTIADCGAVAVSNGADDTLGLEGNTIINGLTVTNCNSGVTVEAGKVTVHNATFGPAKTNNLRVNAGSLVLEKVEVQGHVEGSAANIHGIYVPGGELTAKNLTVNNTSGSAIRVAGGNVNATVVTLTDIGLSGISSTGGVTQITDLKTTNIGTNTVYAGGSVTEDGKTVEAIVKITHGDLCKVTDAHSVKADPYSTIELNNVAVNGAVTVKSNRYGIIAEGGTVKLSNVTVTGVDYSAIHANRETSVIEGTNVVVKGASYGITGSAGSITIDEMTTSDIVLSNVNTSGVAVTLSNSTIGKTTSDSSDQTTGHNVKVTGTGTVELNNVDILGTTDSGAHGILAEGGDVKVNGVDISDAKGVAIRVNKATSSVTGTNVTVAGCANAITTNACEEIRIDGFTTTNITGNNILTQGSAEVTVINGDLCQITNAHNVKAEGGKITLEDTIVRGSARNNSTARYTIMAEGGDFELTDVEITGASDAAIYANRAASEVKGNGVTISDSHTGVRGTAGTIDIDGLTGKATSRNVSAEGATITISNSELDVTPTHNVKQTAGSLTMETVEIKGTTGSNQRGIMIEPPSGVQPTVILDGITVSGTSGSAIQNKGGNITASNVTVKSADVHGIYNEKGTMTLTGSHIYGTTGAEINNSGSLTIGDVLIGYGEGDTNGGVLYQGTKTSVKLTSALRNTAEKPLTIDASDSVWVAGTNLVECADNAAAEAANLVITEPADKEPPISVVDKYLQLKSEDGEVFYVEVVEDGTKYMTINEAVAHIETFGNKTGTIKLLRDVTVSETVAINGGVNITIIDNGAQRDIVRDTSVSSFPFFTVNEGGKLTMTGTSDDARMVVDSKLYNKIFAINKGTVILDKVNLLNPGSGDNTYLVEINGGSFKASNGTIGGENLAPGRNIQVHQNTTAGVTATVELTNVDLLQAKKRNIVLADGTLKLTNVTIDGTAQDDYCILVEKDATKLELNNVTITNAKKNAIRNWTAVITGENVKIDGGTVGIFHGVNSNADGYDVDINNLTILNTTTSGIEHQGGQMKITNATISTAAGNEILNKADLSIGNVKLGYAELGKDDQGNAVMDTNGGVLYQDTTTPVKVLDGYAFGNTAAQPMTITGSGTVWVTGTNLLECKDQATAEAVLACVKQPESSPNIAVMDDGDDATTTCYLQLTSEDGDDFYVEVVNDGTKYMTINEAVAHIETFGNKTGTIKLLRDVTVSETVAINDGVNITIIDNGAQRDIVRAVNGFPMFTVNAGAELTITGTSNEKRIFVNATYSSDVFSIKGTDAKPSVVTLTNVDANNAGTGGGRVIYVDGSSTVTVTNSTLGGVQRSGNYMGYRNVVVNSGNNASVTLNNVVLLKSGNRNIHIKAGSLSMTDVEVQGTNANRGVFLEGSASSLTMSNVTIKDVAEMALRINNSCVVYGENVKIQNAQIAISVGSKSDSTLYDGRELTINNLSTSGITGNNIEVWGGSEVLIKNTDPAYKLGASTNDSVVVHDPGTLTLDGVTIEGSTGEGKNAVKNAATVNLTNCTVSGTVNNTGTATITGGSYTGSVTNSGTLTVTGGSFTGGNNSLSNSGTATVSGASFSGSTSGNDISTTAGTLTISNITVDGKLYVAPAAAPVTYTGTTSAHTTEKPLVIVTDAASFVGGTKLVKCDSADVATALAATFKAQDANGNLIPLVAQDEYLVLSAARYNGVYYASVEDAMTAGRTVYPSITSGNRQTVYDNPVELVSNVVLTEDLTVKYHLSVPTGYSITVTDDGTARNIIRDSSFAQLAVFFQVHDGAALNLVATSKDVNAPTLILDGKNIATGGRSCFVDVLKGATTNINPGVKLFNNKSNAQGAAIQCNGVLNIDGAIFDGNTHGYNTGNGGAISIFEYSTVDIKNTIFQNNTATKNGGAICAYTTQNITVTNCQFINNTANGNSDSGNGGAVYSEGAKLTFTGCTFTGNAANKSYGGAIGAWSNTVLTFDGCSFAQNTATNSGGAIIIYTGSSATLTNCDFTLPEGSTATENNKASVSGGAIADWSTGALVINGGKFANNVAGSGGGAIHHNADSATATEISGVTFISNTAGTSGGAIEAGKNTNLSITGNSVFDSNSAGKWGGAIFANGGANINVSGGSFTNNIDKDDESHGGGAIYQYNGGKLTANGVTFSGNSAAGSGGAISVNPAGSAEITGCSFDSNSSTVNGGAIYVGSGLTVTVDETTTYSTEEGKQNTANGAQNDIYREGQ